MGMVIYLIRFEIYPRHLVCVCVCFFFDLLEFIGPLHGYNSRNVTFPTSGTQLLYTQQQPPTRS